MKKQCFILLSLLILGFASNSQDALFNHSFSNPIYLNPAYTGTAASNRLMGNYKNNFSDVPGSFWESSISYDQPISQISGAFGVNYNYSSYLEGGYINQQFNITYAQHFEINKWELRPAINFGFGYLQIDPDKISVGQSPYWPEMKQRYANFGLGFIVSHKQFVGGFALDHINRPDILDSGEYILEPKISIHGKFSFLMNYKFKITPAFIYQQQDIYNIIMPSVSVNYRFLKIGLAYKSFNKGTDALIPMIGFLSNNLSVLYSYSWTISPIQTFQNNIHELTLVYKFNFKKDPDKKVFPRLYEF